MESIGVDYKILIAQVVNFFILFLLLRWLLYKPVLKILNERKKKIEDANMMAEMTKKEAEELDKSNHEKIIKIKEEAKLIIEKTREDLDKEEKEKIAHADKEAENILAKAKNEGLEERKRILKSIKKELAEIILMASGKLTKENIKPEVQDKLVDEYIMELENKKIEL